MMNLGEKMTELECDALVDVSKTLGNCMCIFHPKPQFVTKLDLDLFMYAASVILSRFNFVYGDKCRSFQQMIVTSKVFETTWNCH